MNPNPSPDGQKIIFERIEVGGLERLWMLSLAGGSPVRVTNAETTGEVGATWSPDGSRLAYIQRMGGKTALMIVPTSSDATPAAVRDDIEGCIPDWSPDGNWITFCDNKGWYMISPDGKNTKFLGALPSQSLVFSKDSRLLYGISGVTPSRISLLFQAIARFSSPSIPSPSSKRTSATLGKTGLRRRILPPAFALRSRPMAKASPG